MTVQTTQLPDPRYGYGVILHTPNGDANAYYLGSNNGSHFIASIDPLMTSKASKEMFGQYVREVQLALPSLDEVEFISEPEVGKSKYNPDKMGRDWFDQLGRTLKQACGAIPPYEVEVHTAPVQHPQHGLIMGLHITAFYSGASPVGGVLITNELRRLGLWDITVLKVGEGDRFRGDDSFLDGLRFE